MTVERRTVLLRLVVALVALLGAGAPGGIGWDASAWVQEATPTVGGDPCPALLAAGTPVVEHGHEHAGETEAEHAAHADTPAPTPAPVPFDLLFIDGMVPHHAGAVEMAAIAGGRAARPEIVALADGIAAAQAAEIEQLRAWRDAWYPDAEPASDVQVTVFVDEAMAAAGAPADGGHGMAGMAVVDHAADGRALCAAPAPFDLAFLERMIPHHESAVAMARLALERAERPELRTLAEGIVVGQERELAQMRGWLAEWFGGGQSTDAR